MMQLRIERKDLADEPREWPEELERWALQLEQQRADFIDMLAHDVGNRLFVIVNYVEILRERARMRGIADDRVVLDSLKSNCLALHELITNYLTLSQLHAGCFELNKGPVDVNAVLARVLQQFVPEAERRQISLDHSLADTIRQVEGDALGLERVFANLLHNALKFTPPFGRVTVTSLRRADEIVVSVVDTGPGITPDEAVVLTGPDAHVARTPKVTGTGLRIVRGLVAAHGGRVEVRSAPQSGSCVSVFLRAT